MFTTLVSMIIWKLDTIWIGETICNVSNIKIDDVANYCTKTKILADDQCTASRRICRVSSYSTVAAFSTMRRTILPTY